MSYQYWPTQHGARQLYGKNFITLISEEELSGTPEVTVRKFEITDDKVHNYLRLHVYITSHVHVQSYVCTVTCVHMCLQPCVFSAVYVLCIWQVVRAVSIQCGQVQRNVGWDSVNTDVYTRHVGVQVWNMCFPCCDCVYTERFVVANTFMIWRW